MICEAKVLQGLPDAVCTYILRKMRMHNARMFLHNAAARFEFARENTCVSLHTDFSSTRIMHKTTLHIECLILHMGLGRSPRAILGVACHDQGEGAINATDAGRVNSDALRATREPSLLRELVGLKDRDAACVVLVVPFASLHHVAKFVFSSSPSS